jgi:uncharacterized protein YebE (UPF0316 family)
MKTKEGKLIQKEQDKQIRKGIIIFVCGLIEQAGYTLYLLALNKYLIMLSSLLMFGYFLIYLLIMKFCFDDKNSIIMLIIYAIATALGNWGAMSLHLIK